MKHKGIKKRTEPFVSMVTRTTKDATQENKKTTDKHHTLSHSIKALYIRIVQSS